MPRFNEEELSKVTNRPGYGVVRGGIKSGIQGSIGRQVGDSRALNDLEPDTGDESLGAKKLQVGCAGKVHIRITFYRRRLADYSRAISEKAIIDCLGYAGLISGDSEKEIWLEDGGQKKVETDEEERTELEIVYPEVNYDNLWVPAKQHLGR